MNPSAIYSKSGKGVQEASGKTSLLKRADRAVLSAIDGRATLAEVAKKVGKGFDAAFEALITQLDKDGFVREVSGGAAGAGAAPPARPAAKPAPPTVKMPAPKAARPAPGEDLDFTGIMTSPLKSPPKPAVDPAAAKRAKEQETALYKARQEAEARAQEERDKVRAEAEAKARTEAETKLRAETEKRLREEAEAKVRAEAEAKAKAVREAAVKAAQEAKAKIEAEAKARIEAERAKAEAERRVREEAERKAKEEAEKARREAEELRQRLEEERKAREEIERKAREEAERKAREEAERKAREDAERKAREDAERKAREEAERKAREAAENKAREEAERKAREAEDKRRREEEETRREQEAQMRRAREEADRRKADAERARREAETRKVEPLPELTPPPPEPKAAKGAAGGLDALMADLDSFSQRDEDERKAKEAAELEAKEERKRKLREEAELREREQGERERREAEDRSRQEEEQQRARDEEERRAREEEERERQEAEERAQRAREALAAKEAQKADDIGVTDADLGMDDVRRDEAAVAKESRKARREREREARRLEKEARERDRAAAKAVAKAAKGDKAEKDDTVSVRPVARVRRSRKWGRPVAAGLFVILLAGIGALHVMPVSTEEYQRAASEALRQPVRIGSARLSLFTGVQLNLTDVRIGDSTRIASARAHPELGSLFGETKAFNRIELDGVTLSQQALAESLSAKAKGRNFSVDRILIKNLKLEGPLTLPVLEADVRLGSDGSVRTVLLHGPEDLLGQITPRSDSVEFDITAASFTLPVAPEVSLSSFAMKGRATPQGMRVEAWGGSVLGGALSGTANLRWGSTWHLDGVLTVRGINAAVFAPALLSEGNAEGTGKFSMNGADPAKLLRAGRVEGSFTIGKGVLGSFDLSRALRTDGREVNGRTQFVEMNGQGTYNGGAVALRNVTIGAGALQAGASADISQSGALSGRIVADVRTASQSLRTTLVLGGTAADPQVRN